MRSLLCLHQRTKVCIDPCVAIQVISGEMLLDETVHSTELCILNVRVVVFFNYQFCDVGCCCCFWKLYLNITCQYFGVMGSKLTTSCWQRSIKFIHVSNTIACFVFFFCILGDFALVLQSTVWRKVKWIAVEEGKKNLGRTFTRNRAWCWFHCHNLKALVQLLAGVSH